MHKVALGTVALAVSLLVAPAAHAQMKVTSDDIKNGAVGTKAMEANVFGCDGSNISPSLKWTGAPEGTKSFAINLYDPDAPTGSASGTGSSSTFRYQQRRSRRTPVT